MTSRWNYVSGMQMNIVEVQGNRSNIKGFDKYLMKSSKFLI